MDNNDVLIKSIHLLQNNRRVTDGFNKYPRENKQTKELTQKNEELVKTNEELVKTNEDLVKKNEDLVKNNEELQNKITELSNENHKKNRSQLLKNSDIDGILKKSDDDIYSVVEQYLALKQHILDSRQ